MKLIDILHEARKNPDSNPKTSVNAILRKRYNDTSDMVANGTTKNLFVSFTQIDKLGINPSSKYNTPLGIYSYPAEYVLDEVGDQKNMNNLPFAGDAPYANIFQVSGNIVDVGEMDVAESRAYYKKISSLWADVSNKPWKEAVDEIEQIINDSSTKAIFSDYPGGRLWYVTMIAAERLFAPIWKSSTPVAWNKLFRSIGVAGCMDQSEGIIHTLEPHQCVLFSIKAIKDNQRVYNKYSREHMDRRERRGQLVTQTRREWSERFAAMSTKEITEFIGVQGSVELIPYIKDKDARMAIIKNNAKYRPGIMFYFSNSSEQEMLTAATLNIETICYMKHWKCPDEVIIQGIRQNPAAATSRLSKAIGKLSEPVMLAFVAANPMTLMDMPNATPRVIQAVIASGKLSPARIQLYAKKHNIQL